MDAKGYGAYPEQRGRDGSREVAMEKLGRGWHPMTDRVHRSHKRTQTTLLEKSLDRVDEDQSIVDDVAQQGNVGVRVRL